MRKCSRGEEGDKFSALAPGLMAGVLGLVSIVLEEGRRLAEWVMDVGSEVERGASLGDCERRHLVLRRRAMSRVAELAEVVGPIVQSANDSWPMTVHALTPRLVLALDLFHRSLDAIAEMWRAILRTRAAPPPQKGGGTFPCSAAAPSRRKLWETAPPPWWICNNNKNNGSGGATKKKNRETAKRKRREEEEITPREARAAKFATVLRSPLGHPNPIICHGATPGGGGAGRQHNDSTVSVNGGVATPSVERGCKEEMGVCPQENGAGSKNGVAGGGDWRWLRRELSRLNPLLRLKSEGEDMEEEEDDDGGCMLEEVEEEDALCRARKGRGLCEEADVPSVLPPVDRSESGLPSGDGPESVLPSGVNSESVLPSVDRSETLSGLPSAERSGDAPSVSPSANREKSAPPQKDIRPTSKEEKSERRRSGEQVEAPNEADREDTFAGRDSGREPPERGGGRKESVRKKRKSKQSKEAKSRNAFVADSIEEAKEIDDWDGDTFSDLEDFIVFKKGRDYRTWRPKRPQLAL